MVNKGVNVILEQKEQREVCLRVVIWECSNDILIELFGREATASGESVG